MKTLTITSDIFANEWASSFLKALMGNECGIKKDWIFEDEFSDGRFIGYDSVNKRFLGIVPQGNGECWAHDDEITFNLDELSVDTKCLGNPTLFYYRGALDLDYLAKQKGIEIK